MAMASPPQHVVASQAPKPTGFDAQGVSSSSGTADGKIESQVQALERQLAQLQVQLQQKRAEADSIAPYSRSFGRTLVSSILAAEGGLGLVDRSIRVGGWVKTGREAGAGSFAFLEVSDGTSAEHLQVKLPKEVAQAYALAQLQASEGDAERALSLFTATGTAVLVQGKLTTTPEGTKQAVELKAEQILFRGGCDNSKGKYPLSKKGHSMETLRGKLHLRPRTNIIAAVSRIRNALAHATHTFFQSRGFVYVHTPLITTSDAEGAGELFQVTTLLGQIPEVEQSRPADPAKLQELQKNIQLQHEKVRKLEAEKASDAKAEKALKKEGGRLLKMQEELEKVEASGRHSGGLYRTVQGAVDYGRDFFGRPAYLTVSGQMQGEFFATALSNVYTFGPTFRAEDSHTSRHLAEFWMIEPEMAFCTLEDDMNCAEDYVRFCCQHLLDHHQKDLDFFASLTVDGHSDKDVKQRLQLVAESGFRRVSYTEAIEILQKALQDFRPSRKGEKLFPNTDVEVTWGIDMSSEHERYLSEKVFGGPVIVYNYPKAIKAFYMRENDDGKTVAAMDVLVPGVGELIGGSQREERLEHLQRRIQELGMPLESYQGYLDIREYGSVPHAGFGLGFERLVLFSTGLENIREVIPFPRWPGHAEF